jgi:hypothetical protein
MALAAKPHAALTRIQVGEQRALLIARWCAYVGLAALVVQTEHGGCAKGTELGPDMLAARRAMQEFVTNRAAENLARISPISDQVSDRFCWTIGPLF